MPDEATRQEIDKAINRTLKDAGLKEPPFLIKDILEYLDVDREFYDLEDVTLLRRTVQGSDQVKRAPVKGLNSKEVCFLALK